MNQHSPRALLRLVCLALSALFALSLGGCAGMAARDPIRMHVVGLEPLEGQSLEMRFTVQLRVQNPNENAIEYDGIALELELNGKPFATGVSNQKGSIPRFGETVIGVAVSVSALSAARQVLGAVMGGPVDNIPYVLRGKLAGGAFGVTSFTESGTLSLPASTPAGKATAANTGK